MELRAANVSIINSLHKRFQRSYGDGLAHTSLVVVGSEIFLKMTSSTPAEEPGSLLSADT